MRRFLSYAKFNLYLAVLGRRPDGFHEVDTVLQSIDLADDLLFEPRKESEIIVECDADDVPGGELNLVYKALALLRAECGEQRGMRAILGKRIPVGAGLGGGSSNAACALGAANLIWDLGLHEEDLERLAAHLGSDVPFFVRGGAQRCTGRGEILEPVSQLSSSEWTVVVPQWRSATAGVYAHATSRLTPHERQIRMLLQFLAKRNLLSVVTGGFNDLEEPAGKLRPETNQLRSHLVAAGLAGVRMAGSGSAWIGFPSDPETTRRVQTEGRRRGWCVLPVRPTGRGWIETGD